MKARDIPRARASPPADAGKRVVVFHDSPDFGGHERAFLMLLPALLDSPRVTRVAISFYSGNTVFADRLQTIRHDKLRLDPHRFHKRRGDPYISPFRFAYRRYARRITEREEADVVLIVQGRIECTLAPIVELSRRLPVVSYIPMAHSVAEAAANSIVPRFMGDGLRAIYYARLRRFIVPSCSVADQVQSAGGTGPVYVVENIVQPPVPATRKEARLALRLQPDARIALFMGRFDAFQKGLDLLLAAIERGQNRLAGWTFIFVGQGSAKELIEASAQRLSGTPVFHLLPWTDRPDLMLAAADILLLPSRFEGVPLVMLEALARGTPILASSIDVFREYLPQRNCVRFSSSTDLPQLLQELTSGEESIQTTGRRVVACAGSDAERVAWSAFESAVLGME